MLIWVKLLKTRRRLKSILFRPKTLFKYSLILLVLFLIFSNYAKDNPMDYLADHIQEFKVERFRSTIPSIHSQCFAVIDTRYPLCRYKYKRFKQQWNEKCHGEKHNVNISDPCSILIYLSEIEPWCPRLPWRKEKPSTERTSDVAKIRTNIGGLLKLLQHKDFGWIRTRAQSSWNEWVEAAKGLVHKDEMKKRRRQRIVVYMGSCDFYPTLLQQAFSGGYLGELVQWTDVICVLYILGHQLEITKSFSQLETQGILTSHDHGCAASEVRHVDRIITDIIGTNILQNNLGPAFTTYRCKLWLLDSFGTESEFNYADYNESISRSNFGNLNLNLQQFFTMYPNSPDNLFMGFAISTNGYSTASLTPPSQRKNRGLIYAKLPQYYEGKQRYLQILHKYLELHGTVNGTKKDIKTFVPDYVNNHGIVSVSRLSRLLQNAKVFIGLGYPYEGPGPLDAIANGCFYINPKLTPPQNRENAAFFAHKPTNRTVASQNPYTEEFIGKPYVYTVDITNDQEVENTIKTILDSKEVPRLPYEFTHEGMLQRVNAFLENLDFCTSGHQWPPKSELRILKGQMGESCKNVCFDKGFLCEPSYFPHLNNMKMLKRFGLRCKYQIKKESIYAPAYNSSNHKCILQEMPLLYSCVARDDHVTRLCPCRTYQREQVALYKDYTG